MGLLSKRYANNNFLPIVARRLLHLKKLTNEVNKINLVTDDEETPTKIIIERRNKS